MELLRRFHQKKTESREDPFLVLERMRQFFNKTKCDLEAVARPAPRQVVVVRRDLDLARPVSLAIGALILALGIAVGRWSKDRTVDSAAVENHSVQMAPAKLEPEAIMPAPSLPAVDSVASYIAGRHSSSSDTLFQKVNDLLERVKRGE